MRLLEPVLALLELYCDGLKKLIFEKTRFFLQILAFFLFIVLIKWSILQILK